MAEKDSMKVNKYTKFKSNGHAPSYTPKYGQTKYSHILQGMKNALKTEKSTNQIKGKGKK